MTFGHADGRGWIDRPLIMSALAELADREYHEGLWLGTAAANEVGSFEEAVSRLFDDSGLGDRLARSGSAVFDTAIDDGLRALDAAIRKIPVVGRDPAELLGDARVADVAASAAEVLDATVQLEGDVQPTGVRVAADYDCHPMWRVESGGSLMNVDPRDAVSAELADELMQWAAELDATLDRADPASSGFPTTGAREQHASVGHQLAERVAAELGEPVEYFDSVAGRHVWVAAEQRS